MDTSTATARERTRKAIFTNRLPLLSYLGDVKGEHDGEFKKRV